MPSCTSKIIRTNKKANLLYWKGTLWLVGVWLWYPEGFLSLANLPGPQFLKGVNKILEERWRKKNKKGEVGSLFAGNFWGCLEEAALQNISNSLGHWVISSQCLSVSERKRWQELQWSPDINLTAALHYTSSLVHCRGIFDSSTLCSLSVRLTRKCCTSSLYLDMIMENA